MRGRLAWSIFVICVLLVIGALSWVSLVVLQLERAGEQARIGAAHQENIRVALWRLDTWFSPYLMRENARPYFEYRPYYAPQQPPVSYLTSNWEDDVLLPSPLLKMRSDLLLLHFQIETDGSITSPQVPTGGFREVAAATIVSDESIVEKERLLDQLGRRVDPEELHAAFSNAEQRSWIDESLIAKLDAIEAQDSEWYNKVDPNEAKLREWSQRAQASNSVLRNQQEDVQKSARQIVQTLELAERDTKLKTLQVEMCTVVAEYPTPTYPLQVSALLPVWIDGPDPTPLLLRRVTIGDETIIQGMLLDWRVLSENLLGEVADLIPNAELLPVVGSDRDFQEADFLASLPIAVVAPAPTPTPIRGFTTERLVLVLVWVAALIALIAAGSTIAASMGFARKSSRFASSVTHELRTPLTTFQMYSEMLADGMVQDEEKRQQYLDPLKGESKRLAALVENVLTWSRVEAGRLERRPMKMEIDKLLSALDSLLGHRCDDSGVPFTLECSMDHSLSILVDRDILERILFNLVDNACKYGANQPDSRVDLRIEYSGDHLRCTVSDNGPGIPRDRRKSIFRPFEQGSSTAENKDSVTGVGLGLALCRELARALNGDLELVDLPGAVFRLEIPC